MDRGSYSWQMTRTNVKLSNYSTVNPIGSGAPKNSICISTHSLVLLIRYKFLNLIFHYSGAVFVTSNKRGLSNFLSSRNLKCDMCPLTSTQIIRLHSHFMQYHHLRTYVHSNLSDTNYFNTLRLMLQSSIPADYINSKNHIWRLLFCYLL